jgi:hypothetical protein
MSKYIKLFIAILFFGALTYCSTGKEMVAPTVLNVNDASNLKIELTPRKAHNHPTFVIWMVDMDENYIKTLFITKSYASGIFGHKMVGDSMWLNECGESIRSSTGDDAKLYTNLSTLTTALQIFSSVKLIINKV